MSGTGRDWKKGSRILLISTIVCMAVVVLSLVNILALDLLFSEFIGNYFQTHMPILWWFSYADFAPKFKAELFDPDHWAQVLKQSGAKCELCTKLITGKIY